jgi:pimeloyl-ACP methyl ester carboxylesterase
VPEPEFIDVATPTVQLRVLTWGPRDAPIALCLHGFPDTAHGWRKVAPLLVDAGYRVVAPFMRGYAPSSIPSDGEYHMGAVMDDALHVLDAVGPTGRDVIVGHDWGSYAATGLAAMPDSPFVKAVLMALPPTYAFRPQRGMRAARTLPALMPGQALRSWYIGYFQLPLLPEQSAGWILPLLWRRWSPGYDAADDLEAVRAAIGAPENWRAALSVYRAVFRPTVRPEYAATLHRFADRPPKLPTLYLHGDQDGCMTVKLADRVRGVLPADSDVVVVERAGHFLQLERPEIVARHIVDFVGRAS